ncbi:hypothetical protein D3C87_1730300 [compost metagenome]
MHFLMIFGAPFAVWVIATITRLAPETRSIAPPMPGTILPGTIQLASWPSSSTCNPPRTVTSRWPPRISANDKALSKAQAPGRAPIGEPPASVRSAPARPGSGRALMPTMPFSDWKEMPASEGR